MAHAQPYITVRTDETRAAFEKAIRNAQDEDFSLLRTVKYWYNTIKDARIKRISWDTIAGEMCRAMQLEVGTIPGRAVCEAFRRAGAVKRKKRRAASVADRLEVALDLLAKARGIDVKEAKRLVDDYVPEIVEKREAEAAAKKAAKAAKDAEKTADEGEEKEKGIYVFYLQDVWKKAKDRDFPSWMSNAGGKLKLNDVAELWEAETGERLPDEIVKLAH